MKRAWGQLTAVSLAVLVPVGLAFLAPTDPDPIVVVWTALGTGGAVYAWQIWRRRLRVEHWRKASRINGLFAITSEQHARLRGLGFWIQVCIAAAGFAAMFNAGRLVVIGLLIVVAALCTVSAWFAERKAEQAARYVHLHPEVSE